FYVSLIPGSSLDFLSTTPADTPSGPAGSVKIAAFTLGDQRYRAIEAGPFDPQSRNFSIMVECDTQAEVDRLWEALTAGGKGIACGWLTDRWGMTWQITPKRLLELINDPDRAKGKRVMETMMKMGKFDIAALEEAARG
ncbi:MAG TPA: VOC family protein, partial [Stellaceae bacterium]